jgi:hypothetical protein
VRIHFPPDLPVSARRDDIAEAIGRIADFLATQRA